MLEAYVLDLFNASFAQGNELAPLSLFFLFMARFLPIIALAPFFGAKILPHPVKVSFAICMFVIFLPRLVSLITTPLNYNIPLIFLFFKEIFIGIAMGFLISMPFTIVSSAGILIDHQRGGASLMVNDPTVQNQSSPLGTLFNYVAIYLFFYIDGPFLFIDAILNSYDLVPPDAYLNRAIFHPSAPFYDMMMKLFQKVMVISIQLSAPALLSILMTDVFLGIANRLAPQVQITFLGMPLKSLLALVVVCLGWKLFGQEIVNQSRLWLSTTNEMVLLLNPGSHPQPPAIVP
jgi:type III secretion protein SpaR/YscT/HrcT